MAQLRRLLIFPLLVSCGYGAHAQAQDEKCLAAVRQKQFVFRAQWANSYNGERRQLIPPYELLLTPDSVKAYLPYYGRMYTVPRPEDLRFMALDFTSRAFSYTLEEGKRDNQRLTIDCKDLPDIRSLSFGITPSCRSTLWVRSAGRDQMYYEGTIEELKE